MSIAFERAKKTFLGFLQARGKALNTVKNYQCDLTELGHYCDEQKLDFQKLGLPELENYHQALKAKGLKPNSRRRKIMTAKSFLRYLSGRMDVSTVGSEKIIPPEKVEKPPRLVPRELIDVIVSEQPDTAIGWRNRALIGVLLDTGMLVSEALSLKRQDCYFDTGKEKAATITIPGKRTRSVRVTPNTAAALKELLSRMKEPKFFFHGFSKAGPLEGRMTPRGVEVLFKTWAKAHNQKHLHPRTLRHMYVVEQLIAGTSEADIMRALALRTPYAFRVYRPLVDGLAEKAPAATEVKSTSETTYSAGSDQA